MVWSLLNSAIQLKNGLNKLKSLKRSKLKNNKKNNKKKNNQSKDKNHNKTFQWKNNNLK